MTFMDDNFLLQTSTARALFHQTASALPIIDYHCHLPPQDIAENRRFPSLFEIWLEGDHYKWRAMRANGEAERLCTGNATPREKFLAWARTVPQTLRNPLYHWTHLELKRYFGIEDLLDERSADAIWERSREALASDDLRVHGILRKFRVEVIGTTDDPIDDLAAHAAIASSECPARVVPTFRPDKAMQTANPAIWNAWVDRLAACSDSDCDDFEAFLEALEKRHRFFHEHGARASDHGLEKCPTSVATSGEASRSYAILRSGKPLSDAEQEAFQGFLLCFFGELNEHRNWAMQLHLGALRNVNAAVYDQLGPDKGCDSISDAPQGIGLKNILGTLSARHKLPKTILYNLNPRDNYLFATMAYNFFAEGQPGKMQLGSGWWFLDQLEGMTWQLNTLSNLGLLSRFVGMLTDSRSFMSFPRHEYFRRLLCNLIGNDVENGLLPDDPQTLQNLVRGICYSNAKAYFGF